MVKVPKVLPSGSDLGRMNPNDFPRYATIAIKDIAGALSDHAATTNANIDAINANTDALNGNLQFDVNLKTKTIAVTFPTANTEVTIPHSLGKIPTGYWQVKSNVATSIYNSTDSDINNLYLKSSAIANVTIVAF